MEVYLVRHTTPDIEKGVCYGQLDIGVKESFEEERERLLAHLPDEGFDTCYASPLKRCAKLAKALVDESQIQYDDRIKELDFGDWEGTPWDDIDDQPRAIWMEDFVERTVPGGESYRTMYSRCGVFWQELIQQPHERVLIVAHGGSIRSLLMRVLGMPLPKLYHFELAFGSVSMIQTKRGREKVIFLNR